MTRKGFLSALAAMAAAPFVKGEKPKKEQTTPYAHIEIRGKDLWVALNNYKRPIS